jgi:hypothetical protein
VSADLIRRVIRTLREKRRMEGDELARGGAKDFAEYKFRAGRIDGFVEAERELLELIDPESRKTLDQGGDQ